MLETVATLFETNEHILWALALGSGALLLVSAMIIPWIIVRLPADFYVDQEHTQPWLADRPVLRMIFLVAKNLVGSALLIAGVLMLFLPGQGILTLLAGLSLVDFPGKRSLELKILRTPSVSSSTNWIRQKAGVPPLEL